MALPPCDEVVVTIDAWSDWRPFPDPRTGDMLVAPFGPSCYELRRISTGQLILFGTGGHASKRMSTLLPKPLRTGTRKYSAKRAYCLEHIADVEYRTRATATRDDAATWEKGMKDQAADYVFGT